ncbi:P-II family nitrogen regulator [Roseofilum sp. BLCC_M154]|jgi:nitrogen regulatory protein PII|uniref:P-II family nitrogen regulator n=1 Tax=Roseofilum acuticapitatum BLCC-M154 TaxID=3022444 RepID=A0ABT7ALN6_9CYAN|nr:hypothetical protein [Roseofilum acuticapitatum]MDJ1167815.1 P-II family nitrogen regulator [Roseofilum acuticapitatum BLCC-M154]
MHPVTRLEIIADQVEMHKITQVLDQTGVSNYTVIENVLHKNLQGMVTNDSAITGLGNTYVFAYCLPDNVKPVLEQIRPILNKFGGTCYISEVMEVRSTRCISSL